MQENNKQIYSGVWIFAEEKNGILEDVVFELLGKGREIASQIKVDLAVVLMGQNIKKLVPKLIQYGADIVYIIDSPSLKNFNDESYSKIFVELVNKYKPEIILVGATIHGCSLAARVASMLNTGLTACCIDLKVDLNKKELLQIRTAFGGDIMATIVCPNKRPQMSTVRPGVMKAAIPNYGRTGKLIKPIVKIPENLSTNVKNIVSIIDESNNTSKSDIIISAGRGVGNAENLKLIKDFAKLLGGTVGATRAVVDNGWIEHKYQIGQTGKSVNPRIYFACGISGAIQHLVGIYSSDIIIAINKDPNAAIFNVATIGIVADMMEIIPILMSNFKKRLKIKV
ncbi:MULTISPECIES: electron transfer flavoprotein subunit alpha/FixB family protein [Clostridium]|uniref:electron transfer flavoprotein subunit alpha/FixB family protein n=1 Tax=Clostridium TaxID=1485 RepID=UPI000825CE18|nr:MULTISPECIES: electron transfer flavoprotein subunit alpha/FixB family protein [Clostridium]PJI10255.1 electron transfer flavoprotein subunit alpha/FixB family protein [Clostridium sp. CT7]